MGNQGFEEEDLRMCDWQYTVRHQNTSSFLIGEKVFLKSNPEQILSVTSIGKNSITVSWVDFRGGVLLHSFPPQCILQYRYASLFTYKKRFHVTLN